MKYLRSLAGWFLWNVPVGSFAPKLMAFYLGCKRWKKVDYPSK